MAYIMVDIEADGPIPGDYSMIALGAVLVEDHLHQQFYGLLKPISENYIPQALAVSGFSREETLSFNNPDSLRLPAVKNAYQKYVNDHKQIVHLDYC